MIVLAIDTATNSCAACLYDTEGKRVLAEQTDDIGRGHAEHLLGLIDQVLEAASLTFDEIDKVAVSIGPGSFTGIRVGVATARSLGLALNKPVVGVSTLEALAAEFASEFASDTPFAVTVQAGRGQAYVQTFNTNGIVHSQPYIVKLDDAPSSQIEPLNSKLIGNAAELVDEARATTFLGSATSSIKHIASLGAQSDAPPNPLYIRSADAKIAAGFALPRKAELAK